MDDRVSAVTTTIPQRQTEWLRECATRAFTEVQRADTKATALCGIAGGLLTVGIAALPHATSRSWVLAFSLALTCALLGAAIGAALWVIRPVVPRTGLRRELVGGVDAQNPETFTAAVAQGRGDAERCVEARRLWVLAALAGRKLQAARIAVDLILAALMVAGMGLLITYISG
ncbi:Pycsar system effector family protein [Streptomyces sp. NPDC056669]|uniref:Pycsar system effector family protein n=1 Tax=Streptomyces sp. NPDC056669 TaxID=3345903 RepID=UPI0036B90022